MENKRTATGQSTRALDLRLRLYVAGQAANSVLAVANLRAILSSMGAAAADLTIIDVFSRPDLATEDHVYVTPMLVRLSPPPKYRIIGSLTDHLAVRRVLELGTGESAA